MRHWQAWHPKAVVCLIHGMGEHVGRYEHVAKFFSVHGFSMLGIDLQGHGKTEGKRGHSEGLDSMLSDIDLLVKEAFSKYPKLPIFLYGHSMGGNLVLNYLLRSNTEFNTMKSKLIGVIASAPWVRLPKPPSAFLIGFAKIMKRIAPKLTQANGLDVNELSNDLAVISAYQNDPLVHDRVSVLAGIELLMGARFLDGFQGDVPCPLLLTHGTLDSITSPQGTIELEKRLKGDVTLKLWPGLKHEIHNEPQQNEVLTFLVEWMGRFI